MRFRFLVVCLVGSLWGCQDQNSVEDPAGTHFIKFYGSDGDQTGRDMVVLSDGSMVLFGTSRITKPTLGAQWYLTKVDSKGSILWENEFGGYNDEEASDIELTSGGNLVLVGNSYKSPTDRDVMIITVNIATGQKIDSATHFVNVGGVDPFKDEDAASVTETVDGFVVAGSSTYVPSRGAIAGLTDPRDALQLRVNTDLSIYSPSWSQTFGYYSDDYSVKIVPGQGGYGSFYVFGSTNTNNIGHPTFDYQFWMLVLGANGGSLGTGEAFSGVPSADEKLSSHCISPAGYFMAGVVGSPTLPQDLYILETTLPNPPCGAPPPPPCNSGFGLLKEKTLSINLGTGLKGATGVTASISGGYLILSEENGFNANQNWMLTRMNSDGTLAWSQPIVFGGEGLDEIGAVQELPDGRIVLIGTMRTGRPDVGEFKMTLVKVSKDGKFEK